MISAVGTSLQNGKYVLNQELGEGGFGRTYKATNQILNRAVVIKTFKSVLPRKTHLADLRKEFLNEAQRLVKCYHPNIVRFYEFFIEDEIPYIVMDYVAGETLDKIVLPESPLPEATAIDYIRQLGEALRVVHSNGLLHRDIKPQNLILCQDTNKVVLIDFGIAREFDQGLVQTHTNLVSDGYAPIEQYLPKAQRTPASDLYGLAATLYTLVTAQIPIAATIRNRVSLSSPQDIRPELSNRISQAIMQGMALEIEDRPKSVDEWLTLLLQEDSNISLGAPKTVAVINPENKPTNLTVVSRLKQLGYRNQVTLGLMVCAALVWGLDSAWLRFRPFSAQEKIQLDSIDQLSPVDVPIPPTQNIEQITPKATSSSSSKQATDIVDTSIPPTQNIEQITPKATTSSSSKQVTDIVGTPTAPTRKIKPITPKKTTPSSSTRVPSVFVSPSKQGTPKTGNSPSSTRVPSIFRTTNNIKRQIERKKPNLPSTIINSDSLRIEIKDRQRRRSKRRRRREFDDDADD